MPGRSYGIAPGSVDRSGRVSPPKYSQPAPPVNDQGPYSDRDVSPVRTPQPAAATGQNDYGFASAGTAGGAPSNIAQDNNLRDIDNLYNPQMMPPSPEPYGAPSPNIAPAYQQTYSQSSLAPLTTNQQGLGPSSSPPRSPERTAQRGMPPMAGAGAGAGAGGVAALGHGFDGHMPRASYYHGDGYDDFDPSSIADDGDDGIENAHPISSMQGGPTAASGAHGAGMLKAFGARDANGGNYGPVGTDPEKSAWLSKQGTSNKRMKLIIIIAVAIIIIGAIVGGTVGGVLSKKNGGGSSSGSSGSSGGSSSGSSGSKSGGLYDINSDEVQAVMNNKNLHKVFPAMDYTPNYAQYPQCLSPGGGPVQNNVTIDVAILSQLTPAIRLYGTDCNQTELVLESIKLLNMQDTMKVWLGVYLNANTTTNVRQLDLLYDVLDKYPHDSFAGAIIGNEVLYGKYLTAAELAQQLTDVRNNFTSKGINLPVATADLGDNWTADLAAASDIVMANIHPFFAGILPPDAAGWAYSFWTNKDQPLTTTKTGTAGNITYPKQIISEIGWPSQGGNDCGDANDPAYGCTSDSDGAVASIDNMNTFMNDWVCGALNNGTTFFWFEAFDEPWKHQFDTAHDKWEPYWGLFDVNRNLKDGVSIPSCGGKTVDKPY